VRNRGGIVKRRVRAILCHGEHLAHVRSRWGQRRGGGHASHALPLMTSP
jgi:hypothetical protein